MYRQDGLFTSDGNGHGEWPRPGIPAKAESEGGEGEGGQGVGGQLHALAGAALHRLGGRVVELKPTRPIIQPARSAPTTLTTADWSV